MSSRQAEFEVLGRNNRGAGIVVGEFDDSLTSMNEEIEGALGCKLTMIPGPITSVPHTVDDAGNRGCEGCLLP